MCVCVCIDRETETKTECGRIVGETFVYVSYIRGAFNKFPGVFCTGIYKCRRLLKMHHVIAIHLMR